MWTAGRGGFTLIEAVVALAVLGLVVVTMAAAAGQALRVEAATLDHLTAATLADARMHEVASLPRGGLAHFEGSRSGRFGEGNERFQWTVQVRPVQESRHLYRAVVRVRWPDGSVEVASVLHREPGIGSGQIPWAVP